MSKSHTPEKEIERFLTSQLKAIGGKAIKMIPTFENGIPDRQVLYKGITCFVELKKQNENPKPLQVQYMKELEKMGFMTRVIKSKEEVKQLISDLINESRRRTLQSSEDGSKPNT